MSQEGQEFIQGKYSICPYVVQKNSNLPGVQAEDFESIPRFLFIQDGKLVHKVVGWPKDGSHLADVKEGFRKLSARPGNK